MFCCRRHSDCYLEAMHCLKQQFPDSDLKDQAKLLGSPISKWDVSFWGCGTALQLFLSDKTRKARLIP